jgi:hypothetical protein
MMLTEKLQILMRIYKKFDLSFSPISYYLFVFSPNEFILVYQDSNSMSTNTNEGLFGYIQLFIIFGHLFNE